MGMFDTVRCDYPIGPAFEGECQSKEFDKFVGGTMSFYYIDPHGYLFDVDTRGTWEWVRNPLGPRPWPYTKIQTGRKGRLRALTHYTDYVTIYPSHWDGSWTDWPEARLHIVNGKIQSVTHSTPETRCLKDLPFSTQT